VRGGTIVFTLVTRGQLESANSVRINYRLQGNYGLSPAYNGSPFIHEHNGSEIVIASSVQQMSGQVSTAHR